MTLQAAEFRKHCQLGSICGGRGCVWSVANISTGEPFAVKIYQLDEFDKEFKLIQVCLSYKSKNTNFIYMLGFL